MKVTLATKYSAPHREPESAGALSLLNPKVQKPLLALQTAMGSRTFLKAAEQLLHAAVPCDVVYTLLHYSADRGRSMIAWGSDGVVFSNDYVQASLRGNPLGWVLATQPGAKTFALCDCYPDLAAMERDPFFLRFIQGIGIYHATVMIFWREHLEGADFVMGPHRGPQWPKFSPEEVATMELIHPHIDAAYRRVNELQSQNCARHGMEEFVALLPLPALLVDWNLTLLFHNDSAAQAVARWAGTDPHLKLTRRLFKLPEDLRTALDAMREEWTTTLRDEAGAASTPFRERTLVQASDPQMRALISMTALRSPHFGKPSFVVRFEEHGDRAQGPLSALTRLSSREQKLVHLVCDGRSNQEIADALGRSVNTVKSELHAVFKKLGIPSRTRLMALLRG